MAETGKTIADEMREAAAKLRKCGGKATPGPWHRPLNTRWKASVRAALPEGEQGTWRTGVDPATGQRETCTVATVPVWSDGRHARKRSGRDLEWIALMDPELAEPLAALLEKIAKDVSEDVYLDDIGCTDEDQCEFQCGGHEEKPICDRCGHQVGQDAPEGGRCACWDAALAVARALNGTAPQEVFAR